jgi:fatty acid desaturase
MNFGLNTLAISEEKTMPSAATASAQESSRPNSPGRAILVGGLISGVLDITAAFVVYGAFGLGPIALLHGIAAGIYGATRSHAGGLATAALGLLCHFIIAFGAAAAFVLASRVLPILTRLPLLFGPLYGIAVYFFMQFAVLPLTAVAQHPTPLKFVLIGCAIHILCVGIPIALIAARLAPPR